MEAMMEEFSVKSEHKGDVIIAAVAGRIDSVTAANLDQELEKLVHGHEKVVLDLTDVAYLSSAGVRAIVKMLRNEQKTGGAVKLAAIPKTVAETLETVGMMELLKAYSTVEEAIASF